MTITRNNYEEFFMLYADNELAAAERAAVEAFAAANPDLQPELVLFQQFKASPDTNIVFPGTEDLLKYSAGNETISLNNANSFFVRYADDELSNTEKAAVEDFVYHHPQVQAMFELLQQVKLEPDNSLVFSHKEVLYRKEEDDKVVPFPWWRLAAAALLVIMLGAFWLYQSKKNNTPDLAVTGNPVNKPQQPAKKAATEVNRITGKEAVQAPEQATVTVSNKQGSAVHNSSITTRPGNKKIIDTAGAKEQPLKDPVPEEALAVNTGKEKELSGVALTSVKSVSKKVEVGKDIAAAKSLPDQQMIITGNDESNGPKAEWASSDGNDKLEVLNTSVNTKNAARGFLRKASRLIAKKANLGGDDGNRKGILIGGFEIAVR